MKFLVNSRSFFLLFALLGVACRSEAGAKPDDSIPGDSAGGQGSVGVDVEDLGETAMDAAVVINEFMPSNATIAMDDGGGAGDWIELYNRSDAPVDLAGYFISDKPDNQYKHELPAGLIIQPGAALLLWADSDIEEGPAHLPFNLKKDGEAVLLTSPEGELLDSIDYQDATTDSSFARVPDGTGAFGFCFFPTPGEPNSPDCAP